MQLPYFGGHDQIIRNLELLEGRIQAGLDAAAEEISILLADYAQSHHGITPRASGQVWNPLLKKRFYRPGGIGWGNVTFATQRGIRAGVVNRTRSLIVIMLQSQTPYSEFLETLRNGKWAWLWPAILANRTAILRSLQRNLRFN